MQTKILLIALIIIAIKISAYSQTRLNGQVIVAANKVPLADVSVSVQGKNTGTVTNDEGRFSLIADLGKTDTLAISYLGYKTQKIAYANIGTNLVIQMDTLFQQLTEVKIKPLTLKQLLDSIVVHNEQAFVNSMKLNGYYREFVYTNNKCTEYADALTSFFRVPNKSSFDNQLKIIASRCAEAKADNKNNGSLKEFYLDSKVPPNKLFEFAMLNEMLDRYLPKEALNEYEYSMEHVGDTDELQVTVFPKASASKGFYRLTFNLSPNLVMQSYRLSVDPKHVNNLTQHSLLGIHVKLLNRYLEVNYVHLGTGIYPRFFKYNVVLHIGGKFLGTTLDQTYNPSAEYVTTDISNDNKPFTRNETYKKGNLCENGVSINDALLRSHNFITPSRKDSLAISQIR